MMDLEIDSHGNVWVAADAGVHIFSHASIASCKTIPDTTLAISTDWIQPRKDGSVWLFARNASRAYKYHYENNSLTGGLASEFESFPENVISTLEAQNGTLIAGTIRNGLYVLEEETWSQIPNQSFIDNKNLRPLLVDREGYLWVKPVHEGILRYKDGNWDHFNTQNSGLTCNTVKCAVEDENGNIIIGTDEHLYQSDPDTNSGLFVYDGSTWEKYGISNTGLENNDFLCLARDSSGAIWAGSRAGLYRWQGDQWDFYCTTRANLYEPCGFLSSIHVDSENRVWVGGWHGNGFYMLNQDQPQCAKTFAIIKPDLNTAWQTDGFEQITWTQTGALGDVNLEYQISNGAWQTITEQEQNERYYNWRLPLVASDHYRVRISSAEAPSIADTSDYFSVLGDGQNLPPILQNIPDSLEANSEETTTWTAQATDPEGDPVTFTISELPSWATVSQSTLTLDPTRNDSSATVRVIAADNNGGADTADLYIVVSHATTAEWGFGEAVPSANMLHVGIKKINLPAGKIKRVTLFNVQGKMIATVDTKNEHANLLRITKNITDSFVVAKIQYGDKTSIQRTICLIE